MNITTDDIYSLIVRHNSKKNQNKSNKIDENDLMLTNGIIMNNSNISSIIYNSIEKNIVYNFKKLEFLSLRNNSLRNIDFITELPNLFYLDLYQNAIEDFSALTIKNIFGFLRLSIDTFNEKKLLSIKNLTINILMLQIQDQKILKHLKYHNPNITLLNNQLNYMFDSLNKKENRRSTLMNYTSMKDLNEMKKKKKNSGYHLNLSNENLINIQKYYDRYEKTNKKILNVLGINTIKELKNNREYIKLEKDKLLLLCQTYIKILHFNNNVNNFYINNKSFMDFDINLHQIKFLLLSDLFRNNDNILKETDIIRIRLIILTSVLMLFLNTISENLCVNLINYILETHFNFKLEDLIPTNLNFNSIHLFSIYFFLYDDFMKEVKQLKLKNIFYEKIINIISMDSLILKGNELVKSFHEFQELKQQYSKILLIKHKIHFIKNMGLYNDFSVILQFFSDYIVYENISNVFLNRNLSTEYSDFIQFKEIYEKFESENSNSVSLSDKKFQRLNLETLTNKFFFKQEKIKLLKKKLYPVKWKKITPKIKVINYEEDYEVYDDIETNPYIQIKNIKKHTYLPIKNFIRTSENTNPYLTNFYPQIKNNNYSQTLSNFYLKQINEYYPPFISHRNNSLSNENKFNLLKTTSPKHKKHCLINDYFSKNQNSFRSDFKGKVIRLNHSLKNKNVNLVKNENEETKNIDLNKVFFIKVIDTETLRSRVQNRRQNRVNHISIDKRYLKIKMD